MENPLYPGQSIAASRWVVGAVLLARLPMGAFALFFEYCGQLPWNLSHSLAATNPFSFFNAPPFRLKLQI